MYYYKRRVDSRALTPRTTRATVDCRCVRDAAPWMPSRRQSHLHCHQCHQRQRQSRRDCGRRGQCRRDRGASAATGAAPAANAPANMRHRTRTGNFKKRIKELKNRGEYRHAQNSRPEANEVGPRQAPAEKHDLSEIIKEKCMSNTARQGTIS